MAVKPITRAMTESQAGRGDPLPLAECCLRALARGSAVDPTGGCSRPDQIAGGAM